MTARKLAPILAMAIGLLILAFLSHGCGAKANDLRAEVIPGPGGVTCYAIVQGGNAVGGNCL